MTVADESILIGVGIPPEQARRIGTKVVTGITAAGSAITDAQSLYGRLNIVSTTAASTGVQLPEVDLGVTVIVKNGGASTLAVYPSSATQKLNGGSDGAAFSVATTRTAYFQRIDGTDTIAALFAAS